ERETELKKADQETRKRLTELDQKLRTGQPMRDRLAQAKQAHLQHAEALKEIPALTAQAEASEGTLAREEYAPELKTQIAELQLRIKAIHVDERAQARINTRLQQLAGAERDLDALQPAEQALPGEQQQAAQLSASILQSEELMAADRTA